jgi:peptidoglycan L-alanyl-D-glutamate endopeptidase CwlK
MRSLNAISKKRLSTCNTQLQLLFTEAIKESPYNFIITCGERETEIQQQLYALGRTKPGKIVTMIDGIKKKSKHNYKPSLAVDIAIFDENNKLTWEYRYYKAVSDHILQVAFRLKIKIKWGGNFKSFKDSPHYEI